MCTVLFILAASSGISSRQ